MWVCDVLFVSWFGWGLWYCWWFGLLGICCYIFRLVSVLFYLVCGELYVFIWVLIVFCIGCDLWSCSWSFFLLIGGILIWKLVGKCCWCIGIVWLKCRFGFDFEVVICFGWNVLLGFFGDVFVRGVIILDWLMLVWLVCC